MKYLFVARLYGLKLKRTLNKGVKVVDNLSISTSKERLDRVCDGFFQTLVGKLEYDDLYNGPYVYAEGDYEFDNENDEDKRMGLLNYFMRLSQTVSSSLWLIKDNSIATEQGFLYIYNENALGAEESSVSVNGRATFFLNSRGENVDTDYTYDELVEGLKIHGLFFNDGNTAKLDHIETANIVTTKANRIERFEYFLQSARSDGFLPNKISIYCTALETILSTDNQEISHKISERLARLIGKDLTTREEIFKFTKVAYSIRSSNVHGDKLPKKFRSIDNQYEVAYDLDNYIRKVFRRILENDELRDIYNSDSNEKLIKYFNTLVLL